MAEEVEFDPTTLEPPEPVELEAVLLEATPLGRAMWDNVRSNDAPGPKAYLAQLRREAERKARVQ